MLYFVENIKFVKHSLTYYGLGHLVDEISIEGWQEGCWEEAGNIVAQLKDKVPTDILHKIYDTINTPMNAYAALKCIDSSYEPWRLTVATNPRCAKWSLEDIDNTYQPWIDSVATSADTSYLALLYINSEYEPWRKAVTKSYYHSFNALRRIDSTYQPWIDRVEKTQSQAR